MPCHSLLISGMLNNITWELEFRFSNPSPRLLLLLFVIVAVVCVSSDFSERLLWSMHFCAVWTTEVSDWLVYWSANGFVVISLDASNQDVSQFLPRAIVLLHAYATQQGSFWIYTCLYFMLYSLKVSLMCDFRAYSSVSWVYIYMWTSRCPGMCQSFPKPSMDISFFSFSL